MTWVRQARPLQNFWRWNNDKSCEFQLYPLYKFSLLWDYKSSNYQALLLMRKAVEEAVIKLEYPRTIIGFVNDERLLNIYWQKEKFHFEKPRIAIYWEVLDNKEVKNAKRTKEQSL